jgi:N utilization substance protein A
MQRLRQAEKEQVCEEFSDRMLDLVSGVVVRVERGEVYVDLMRAEAVMTYNERIPGEEYQPGDHFTGVLLRVNADQPGPSLYLSRSNPALVSRLFEREVSEISEGLVEIKAVAREPGYRSKVAVHSKDSSVDPVGACVGLRGTRVKTIVRELGGEKVDIIRWDENIKTFVANALQPAKLAHVTIDEENHEVHIDAPEDQLSLAIGKKGQNARLAAKLTGWRVDIRKLTTPEEAEFESKVQNAIKSLVEQLPMLSAEDAKGLVSSGFLSVEGLVEADASDLTGIENIDEDRAQEILAAAREYAKSQS